MEGWRACEETTPTKTSLVQEGSLESEGVDGGLCGRQIGVTPVCRDGTSCGCGSYEQSPRHLNQKVF